MAKKKLEFKQSPLLERIQIKLSDEKKRELVNWIDSQRDLIDQSRVRFIDRHKKYLHNWDDFITFVRKGPYEESSNVHLPLTAIMVKNYHSRLYNIFSDPHAAQVLPRETTDDKQAEMVRRLREWYLWDYLNGYKGIRSFVREVFYDTVTVGFGIGMKDFVTEQRKIIDIVENELSKEMEDLGGEINAQERSELETEEETETKRVSIAPYKEIQKIITVFEGTRLRSIPFESTYFPNHIPGSNDLDFPPLVGVDTEMSESEMRLKVLQGEWDEDAVAESVKGPSPISITQTQVIKQERDRLSGWNLYPHTSDDYLVEYNFCRYDIDDDGLAEELVVTKCKRNILKITFLDRISKSGKRPLFKFDCFSKSRQAYSRGVPEFMYPLNEEMDKIHNMRMDYLALQAAPFGVYRASSSLKNQPIRIAPGKFIPVDETTDLKVFNFSVNATALSGEEDRLWGYADRLSSSSSIQQGLVPDVVGPLRSTSGVMTLLRQMEKEFKVTVEQCAEQWKKLEMMVLFDDLDFRISPEVKMRVLGASIDDYIDKNNPKHMQLAGQALMVNSLFDLKIDVAQVVSTDEMRRNEATVIMQTLVAPSLLQQMGVVGPKALYKTTADFLKTYGRDCKDYLDEPEYVGKALTLYQEIQICSQGEMPPMALQDDHQGKAEALAKFTQEPAFMQAKQMGRYVSNADEFFIRAARKHMVLLEMTQPKGLPNPSGAQGENMSETMTGTSPQQGGQNPAMTTSREIPETEPNSAEGTPQET